MEAQAPMPTNPGQVVDDPLAPLRLQPLEQISDFWKRYDRLADIHDKTLTSNLNGNLDVLIIFAALFSAINTAFISITMPDLSPNPSDETNALLRLLVMRADNNTLTTADLSPPFSPNSTSIIVNCLLYASLSCSLLAAVGAMMAKEWLQSFNRSGQTGPLEEQGKFRQSKFNGVEQWHLEAVIKFLPNLLLLSVVLFFGGIGLFLFPINTAVSGTVIAFSGLGAILSSVAIVAGAISPLCPYQSAASNAVRRSSGVLFRFWMILSRTIIHPVFRAVSTHIHRLSDPIARVWIHLSRLVQRVTRTQAVSTASGRNDSFIHRALARLAELFAGLISLGGKAVSSIFRLRARWHNALVRMGIWNQHFNTGQNVEAGEQTVTVQAACWLLQTTSNHGDQVAVARFIRSLAPNACTPVLEDSRAWHRLLSLTCEALDVWDSQPSEENRELAEVFGMVLCHVPLPFPESSFRGNQETAFDFSPRQKASGLSEAFLQALEVARVKYEGEDEERIFHLAFLSTLIIRLRVIKDYQWADLAKLFIVDNNPPTLIADSLLGMWAYAAYRMSGGTAHWIGKLEELMEIGRNTKLFTETLAYAIGWSVLGLQSARGEPQLELNAARAYFVCLRRARELAQNLSSYDADLTAQGMFELVMDYFDPMTASESGRTPVEFVKLSKETVLGLRYFIDSKASENGSSVVGISESEQLLDDHFVAAVADILMDIPGLYREYDTMVGRAKPSLIKILLWAWNNMSELSMSSQERRNIFLSSCRLWAPLEKEVEIPRAGPAYLYDKSLTPNDLKRITGFIDYMRKDRANSEFISRNADVGINRVYVHFEQRVDWEYELFDFWEPHTLCSRSSYLRSESL